MTQTVDTLIIGNGALGCAIAYTLSKADPTMKIGLLGPSQRPGSASVAAGYMLNVNGELETGCLDKTENFLKYHNVLCRAKAMWPAYAESLGFNINYGTVILNNGAGSDMDDSNYTYIKEQSGATEISTKDIKGYKPANHKRALRALFLPDEGYVESAKLFAAYDRHFSLNKQIVRIFDKVSRIWPESMARTVGGQTISYKNVVIANGAFASPLLEQLGLKCPRVFFGVGSALHLSFNTDIPGFAPELPEYVIRSTNRGNACGIHLVPYSSSTCYVGASNLVTSYYEDSPRLSALHGVITAGMEEISMDLYKANTKIITGYRPTSADTYPLVGPTSLKGVYVATGTKRDGVHSSPFIAESITNLIMGRRSDYPEIFKPERRIIYNMTREEGINKAVEHRLSGAYQHGLILPHAGWEGGVEAMIRAGVKDVYDRLNLPVGIPPELLNMYAHGHVKYEEAVK